MLKIREYLGNVQVIDADVITTCFASYVKCISANFIRSIYTYFLSLNSSERMVLHDEFNMH